MSVSKFLALLFSLTALQAGLYGQVAVGNGSSRWATFVDESHHLYALSVQPKEQLEYPRPSGYEVVVLFDTSASQNGWVRREALEVLDEFSASLPAGSKLALIACDVEAVDLSSGLVAPTSSQWQQAVAKLKQRTPLGATDLARGLKIAQQQMGTNPTIQRTIVYIGDGINRQGFLTPKQHRQLVDSLVAQRITISTLLIGPVVDVPTLAAFVNQTGGVLYSREAIEESAQLIGRNLALSTAMPVVWVESAELPKAIASQLPARFPPLRIERDTVVLGQLKPDASLESGDKLLIQALVAGQKMQLSWNVTPEPSNLDLGFLTSVVDRHQADQGLNLPTVGSDGLRALSHLYADSAVDLIKSGGFALRSGQPQAAAKIAEEALKQDPNNMEAIGLLNAAEKAMAEAENADNKDQVPTGKLMQFGGAGDRTAAVVGSSAGGGDLLAQELEVRKAASEAIERDIRVQLRELRTLAPKDPIQARNQLKLLLERLDDSADISTATRNQLRDQIGSAVQAVASEEVRFNQRLRQSETLRAQSDSAQRVLNETRRNEESLKQLVEHFNELMSHQRYLEASKDVAPEIAKQAPGTLLEIVTREESSLLSNYSIVRDAFKRREQGFVDAMRGVEEAAVPFDGTPSPVIYPPAEIWQALTARRKERYGSFDLAGGGDEKERRLHSALKQTSPEPLSFQGVPLRRVITTLSEQYNVPMWINEAKLTEEGIDVDSPIVLELPPVSLRSALRLMLKPLALTYIIRNEVMEITTDADVADGQGIPKVYPVGDLVVQPMPMMGGGMMGGMGGMGGGMMGGGMGGMGGGMMGGGMGGMGGGMFLVPDDASKLPSANRQLEPEQWVTKYEGASEDEVQSLNKQFSEVIQHHVEIAQAHVEAKQLDQARTEFQQVIKLIQTMLSAGYPQPWMYQALSLSMEACNYPHAEVRRVVLSSLDFGSDLDQAYEVARFMVRKGMKAEALQLLRDLAVVQPLRYELFSTALPLAKELEDMEHLRWVCVGILSKAWPKIYTKIYDDAELLAEATVLRLKQSGQIDLAKEFSAEIQTAKQRDIVVRLNWTGKADLDIRVQEPSGSICSLANPLTLGGGVLLGDSSSLVERPSLEGTSEYYVCAAGFAGQYDVLVRRVWGEVSGGKATVEIYTGYGTPDQRYISQEINISKQDTLLQITVPNGKRNEPISDAQLAGVKARQLATSRALLAQIGSGDFDAPSRSNSQNSASDYLNFRQDLARNNPLAVPPGFPFRRGVVGYRPEITVIPEGAMMSVTGVASADRRYVRLAPSPNFTGIGEVLTFNFVSGGQGQGTGGTGGFGGGGIGAGGGGAGGVL